MVLFGNVCICAIKILIGNNSIIVWHNQMKIGWYGNFKKKTKEKDTTSHVPKFVNVHHVVIKTFQGSQFEEIRPLLCNGIRYPVIRPSVPISYVLAERIEYIKDTFGKRVIGNLRAGRVVLRILRVPWCHARMPDALT